MKRAVKKLKVILSIVLMGILMLNMCCLAFCMERNGSCMERNAFCMERNGSCMERNTFCMERNAFCMERNSAVAGNAVQQVFANKTGVTIPKGLTPEVAAEYLKIVKDLCKKYGPERLCWRDDELVPHRVGFCGGMFLNLDGDGVPDMVLASREEDRNTEYRSTANEQIWTWRNGAPHMAFESDTPFERAYDSGYGCILKGKDRDYIKSGSVSDSDDVHYTKIGEDGDIDTIEDGDFPDESKFTTVRFMEGDTILLANSDHFLYTLACAAAEADGSDPQMILAEMGYAIDPSSMRGETEEYDPAEAAVGKNGEVDWYGLLRSLYDYDPQAFADTSTVTSVVHSVDDMGWHSRNGILGADILDMDGDGKDDLVLYRLVSSQYPLPHEDVYLSVYSRRDGKINGFLEGCAYNSDMAPLTGVSYDSIRIGVVTLIGGPYIWTEYAHVSHYANGSTFTAGFQGIDENYGGVFLRPYWEIGKTDGRESGPAYSLRSYGELSDEPDSDVILWTERGEGPCADEAEAVGEGYKRIGMPLPPAGDNDPTTETDFMGDKFRDQFPTYWNTEFLKKSLRITESGTGPNDNREMTATIDDYTGLEENIQKKDGVYSQINTFLENIASGDPSKVTAPGSTGESTAPAPGSEETTDYGPASGSRGSTGYAPAPGSEGTTGVVSADAEVGDTVKFGSFVSGADQEESSLEWMVLEKQDDRALLISKYGVDCLPYNDQWVKTTWADCSLRSWLNDSFLEEAFSSDERKSIITQTVVNRDNGGNSGGEITEDQVFILDIKELEKYFSSDEDRKIMPTEYAQNKGAFVDTQNQACWYWVRNPGDDAKYAAYVNCKGDILHRGNLVFGNTFAVRPAIWVYTE